MIAGLDSSYPSLVSFPSPSDEHRHQPGSNAFWQESWSFEFALGDGSLGGYVRLGLVPHEGRAWYWAGVLGRRRQLVSVRDHDVPIPGGRALELRGEGLWADHTCETPLEHWTLGLEAFAVGYDDPLEAWGAERGDRVALGLDLEWEAVADPEGEPGPDSGFHQACLVHGDVLVGSERISVTASGSRQRRWGLLDWGSSSRWRLSGRLDDDTDFTLIDPPLAEARTGAGGLFDSVRSTLDGRALTCAPVAHSPILLPAAGRPPIRVDRALCRYDTDDGRGGWGWAERSEPPDGAHLG